MNLLHGPFTVVPGRSGTSQVSEIVPKGCPKSPGSVASGLVQGAD